MKRVRGGNRGYTPERASRAATLGVREHFAIRIARLVKRLDYVDANNLVYAYSLYPDEVSADLKFIEPILCDIKLFDVVSAVSELLDWYRYKALADLAGSSEGLRPKHTLSIFQSKNRS